jgi:hypothetical protein
LALIEVTMFRLPFGFHRPYSRVTGDLLQLMRITEAVSRSIAKILHSHKAIAIVPKNFISDQFCPNRLLLKVWYGLSLLPTTSNFQKDVLQLQH